MRLRNTAVTVIALVLAYGANGEALARQDAGVALRAAASRGEIDAVRTLLADGVPVDAASEYGATALMLACLRGHEEIVRLLIETGADVERADDFYGRTPLAWAAEGGHENIVTLLFTADLEGFNELFNAAVRAGNVTRVAELLEMHVPDGDVLSAALQHAIDTRNQPLGELLAAHGAVPPPPEIVAVDPSLLALYEGVYVDEVGYELEVRADADNGGLQVRPPRLRNALLFLPVNESTFVSEQSLDIFVRFVTRDGAVVSMTFTQPGETRRMTKR